MKHVVAEHPHHARDRVAEACSSSRDRRGDRPTHTAASPSGMSSAYRSRCARDRAARAASASATSARSRRSRTCGASYTVVARYATLSVGRPRVIERHDYANRFGCGGARSRRLCALASRSAACGAIPDAGTGGAIQLHRHGCRAAAPSRRAIAGKRRRPGRLRRRRGKKTRALSSAPGRPQRAGGRAGRRFERRRRCRCGQSRATSGRRRRNLRSARRRDARVLIPRSAHARRRSTKPSLESVDVNRSDAAELAAVPGIGRAVAQRIVELRRREGGFASLDELLDVAGMTQSRLERARPYLRQP